MKRIILYFILSFFTWQLAMGEMIEKEGLSFYSNCLKREVSYSVILPDGYNSSNKNYPVLYLFHGVGGDCSSWLEYGNVANVMDRMAEKGDIAPFIIVIPDGYLSYYADSYDGSFPYEHFFTQEFVSFIDHTYRTKKDASQRVIAGFSMGGFGALSVGLRNRNLFGAVAALSASIRTDKQYCEEIPQEGWDHQWGRIFGAPGKTGIERLTMYYKQRSPYHILASLTAHDLKDFALFFDIGDKEGSLCRSNEELHVLLLQKKIPHSWMVRSGGHDFTCWNAALPGVLIFADKRFGHVNKPCHVLNADRQAFRKCRILKVDNRAIRIYLPAGNDSTYRKYPIIYIQGDVSENVEKTLITRLGKMINKGSTWPVIACFLPKDIHLTKSVFCIEKQVPEIRNSQRMRGLICLEEGALSAVESIKKENLFTGIVLVNPSSANVSSEEIVEKIKSYSRYPRCWIEVSPQFGNYLFSSQLHVGLQESGLDHEFRSRDLPIYSFWEDWITYLNNRIHI
nr:alpha/beta hydrolase-fold protein [uncultured Bacteroides sp.]